MYTSVLEDITEFLFRSTSVLGDITEFLFRSTSVLGDITESSKRLSRLLSTDDDGNNFVKRECQQILSDILRPF